MNGVGVDSSAGQALRELLGIQDVRQLRPAVRHPAVVGTRLLIVDIVPIHGRLGYAGRLVVRPRGQEHHPAAVGDHWLHQPREEVPTEVVHPDLHLKAVDRFTPLRDGHDPGVVNEDVSFAPRRLEPFGEGYYRLQRSEVQDLHIHVDAIQSF